MNNIQKNKDTTGPFQADILLEARSAGKQYGILNRPTTLGEFMAIYFKSLQHKVQIEINRINLESNPLSAERIADQTQKFKDEKCSVLQADLCPKEIEYERLKHQKDACGLSWRDFCTDYLIRIVVFLLLLTDGILLYQALINSSFPRIGAILLAFGVSAGIFVSTGAFAEYIQNARTGKKKWLRAILISVVVYIAFFGIALLRGSAVQQDIAMEEGLGNAISTMPQSNPFALAGLSLFVFLIGLTITLRYRLTPEDRENRKVYRTIKSKMKECKEEIGVLKDEMNKLNDHADSVYQDAVITFEEAAHKKQTLTAIAHDALHEFIKTNMCYRKGPTPDFFANPPKFNFYSFLGNNPSSHPQNEII